MKKLFIAAITVFISTSFKTQNEATIDKSEAIKAFTLLNDIRTNTQKYQSEFPFLEDTKVKNTKLIWNDTLARVAEIKALDMANRNYYDHVNPSGYGINYYINQSGYHLNKNWTKEKKLNYFESIAANADSGEDAIRIFIIDNGVPSLGHRKHLLGVDEWYASLVDIGIGFVRCKKGCKYQTYVSFIIAKHN